MTNGTVTLKLNFSLHKLTWWWHLLVKGDEIKGNGLSRECAGMQGSSWKMWNRDNLEDPDTNRWKILKWILQIYGGMQQTDLSGQEQGQVASNCEVGIEALHSMKFYKFLY